MNLVAVTVHTNLGNASRTVTMTVAGYARFLKRIEQSDATPQVRCLGRSYVVNGTKIMHYAVVAAANMIQA